MKFVSRRRRRRNRANRKKIGLKCVLISLFICMGERGKGVDKQIISSLYLNAELSVSCGGEASEAADQMGRGPEGLLTAAADSLLACRSCRAANRTRSIFISFINYVQKNYWWIAWMIKIGAAKWDVWRLFFHNLSGTSWEDMNSHFAILVLFFFYKTELICRILHFYSSKSSLPAMETSRC